MAVSPGNFGIGTFAPPLDAAGNSVRGQRAIIDITNRLGANPYAHFS
jgi:glutaminase